MAGEAARLQRRPPLCRPHPLTTPPCPPRRAPQGTPRFLHGATQAQPVLPVPGEVFSLRKLLPQTPEFDFNVHVMDFLPGEHLNVKEVHYNQHGLLLLQGKGIYRCGRAGCLCMGAQARRRRLAATMPLAAPCSTTACRLGSDWYPVQAGDAIWWVVGAKRLCCIRWHAVCNLPHVEPRLNVSRPGRHPSLPRRMAPYVPQWYAALGTQESRYILYKVGGRLWVWSRRRLCRSGKRL